MGEQNMATKFFDISYAASPAAKARFDRLCREAAMAARSNGEEGIGTLGEKRLHAVIKQYLCADHDLHEVGVRDTGFVADVRIGNDIYEVQTGAFYPMKKKIAHYMEHTEYTVTVVHPISAKRLQTPLIRALDLPFSWVFFSRLVTSIVSIG